MPIRKTITPAVSTMIRERNPCSAQMKPTSSHSETATEATNTGTFSNGSAIRTTICTTSSSAVIACIQPTSHSAS